MPIDVDRYRRDTDRLLSALEEEYYLSLSGLKEELQLAPIYDRFARLTTAEAARELGDLATNDASLVHLCRSACEGYIEKIAHEPIEAVAELEATLDADVGGAQIPYQMLYTEISNEPNRERRQLLDRARIGLVERHLGPHLVTAFEQSRGAIRELGAPNAFELYTRLGFPLAELAISCRMLLQETEALYVDVMGQLAEHRINVSLDDLERHDLIRLWRAPEWDDAFPSGQMLPALEATLGDLGIDLHQQDNIELDVEDRPSKRWRPSCLTIEVPGRVILLMKPIGGVEDWRGLFHEAGHTEHFAHTRASLPVEARRLGDDAVTEGFAFLMELLVDDPRWRQARSLPGDAAELAHESAAMRLHLVRRYCGKLLYELELHGEGDLDAMPDRYSDLVGAATRVDPGRSDYLLDIDSGFYSSCYLRAWALEAQLSSFLTDRYGPSWFTRREAGEQLKEWWQEGQSMSADELIAQATGEALDISRISERIRSRLN